MIQILDQQIEQINDFNELVSELKKGFQTEIETPLRHHHDFPNPVQGQDSSLLLMPSWQVGDRLGVKIVTVSPKKSSF